MPYLQKKKGKEFFSFTNCSYFAILNSTLCAAHGSDLRRESKREVVFV